MRVLVCGGRDYSDYDTLKTILSALHLVRGPFEVLIHGGARGADRLAGQWAERHQVPQWAFPANWEKFGRGAGPIRNTQMLYEGKPDLVVAFPGGRGTADMVRRAREIGVEVLEP